MATLAPARASAALARRELVALALWALLVAVAVAWGAAVRAGDVGIEAAPLFGHWSLRLDPGVVPALAVAAVVVAFGPAAASSLPWRALPVVAGATSVLWAVTLAASDGWDQLTRPLTSERHEYEPYARTITSARDFLDGFAGLVPHLPTHPSAHPPGATLVPWLLDRIGLGGAGWFAALVIVAWGVAIGAALVACGHLAGHDPARRAAPALVLLPAAIWAATSADALFAGVTALGVALAVTGGRRAAVAGGLVLGLAALLSYGVVLALAIPAAVAWHRRRLDDLAATVVAAGAVLVLVAVTTGFWWFDGLAATRDRYWSGLASVRPGPYLTLAGNPAALALAAGPAVAVGFARRVRNPLVVGALLAVAVADLSQLSRGEVERIWLPFVPWLALAAKGDDRRLLVLCAALALVIESSLGRIS